MLALRPRNYAPSQSARIHSERGYSCSLLSCNIKAGWFFLLLFNSRVARIFFFGFFYNNIPVVCWPSEKNFKSIIKAAAGSVRDTCSAAASVMKMSCSTLFWDKVSVSACVSLCVFMSVRKRSERTGEEESQSEIPARPRANANICLIFCAVLSPPYGTDSNNCEHLGSLQALHAKPLGLFTWDRRPRAASIPTQELPGAGRLSLVTQEGHRDWKFCQTVLH